MKSLYRGRLRPLRSSSEYGPCAKRPQRLEADLFFALGTSLLSGFVAAVSSARVGLLVAGASLTIVALGALAIAVPGFAIVTV